MSSATPEHAAQSPSFWDLVDAVLVINLDHRPERWERLREESAGLIPSGKLHRVSAVLGKALPGFGQKPWFRDGKRDSTWAGRAGCTLAHRRALETAKAKGWRRVLVLEDDVSFAPIFSSLASGLGQELKRSEWDVCYLGYTDPSGPFQELAKLPEKHSLWRVFGCNCAHAYLVDESARDWMLSHLPNEQNIWDWLSRHRAVDRWYLRTLGRRFRVVAVSPSAVNQAAGFSDIVGKTTDYQQSGLHQTFIRQEAATRYFGPKLFARRQATRVGEVYDSVRGVLKRWRGF